jgi:uncharacterized protein (DUF305 family)
VNRKTTPIVIASVVLTATIALSACGNSSSTATHNARDVTFATIMIPHHRQAVEMAELAKQKTTNIQIGSFALAIKSAQDPEIAIMSGWLKAWGQPVTDSSDGHDVSAMDGTAMEGMMSGEEMRELAAASGAEFNRLWLELMIKHHQGAVTMATEENAQGRNVDSKRLAQRIVSSQNTEITAMRKLLAMITDS